MCIVTPTILVSGRIHSKALSQKMQLNKVGVGSATESVRWDDWVGGMTETHSGLF